jgi:16S rRNA (guanine527-N7)-methyltransferase
MSRGPEADPPLSPEGFQELLSGQLAPFDLATSEAVVQDLSEYLAELDTWRRTSNLIGDLSGSDMTRHALESVLGAGLIAHGERVVDIGSGAGFPGLPIAIARPDLTVTLVEPRQKRCAFLRHVIRAVGLKNTSVIEARIEKVGGQTFSVATTRAVGGFSSWLGDAGFLKAEGVLLAWTTEPDALAMEISERFTLERASAVPGSERRQIVLFRKRAHDVPRGTSPGL